MGSSATAASARRCRSPGQEGAGVVTALGEHVKSVKVGDRVAWSGTLGTYAEFVVASADSLVPIPDAISDQQAAAAMMHGLTAHYLVNDAHKLKAGETALVHAAAGGVGLLLVQMARAIGASVIGTASSDEKAKLAREAGANEVIVFTRQDFEAEVKRLTGGKGVEVVYDGVGNATFEKNLNVMRLRGMLVLYGMSSGPVPPVNPAKLSEKGSLYMARTTLAHFTATREELLARTSALFAMIADGRIKLRLQKLIRWRKQSRRIATWKPERLRGSCYSSLRYPRVVFHVFRHISPGSSRASLIGAPAAICSGSTPAHVGNL